MNNKLNQIIYISLPEGMAPSIGNFQLNPGILIPLEVPEGIDPNEWQAKDLSWEMIVSGMLKVLAYDKEHKDLPYFRDFINAVKPDISAELTQSAIIKSQAGDFELAEEIFSALISLNRDDLRSQLNKTLLLENKFKAINPKESSLLEKIESEIEEGYTQILDKGEDLPDIYFNAAWYYYSRQNFKRAYDLSDAYLNCGEDEIKLSEAEKLKRECAELKDTDELYLNAYKMVSEDKNEEGLRLIENFLEENSAVWNGWFLKGWALRKLSRFQEAYKAFEKAQEYKGPHCDILNELAICSLENNEFDLARKFLEEALNLEPENLKVISNMGILALREGNREEAAAFFRTVLVLDPEDPMALSYLDFIEKS